MTPPPDVLEPVAIRKLPLTERPFRFETIGAVLAETPGIQLYRLGGIGASQYLSIRGTDFDHLVVLVDDIPLVGPDRAAVDFSLLPVDGFEAVEVFARGAPIRYGGGAIGGVVRLVPRDGQKREVSAAVGAGSFGALQGRASLETWSGPFSLFASVGGVRADNDFGYVHDGNTALVSEDDTFIHLENAWVDQAHAFVRAGYDGGRHQLRAMGMVIAQERGLPGPSGATSLLAEEPKIASQRRTRWFGSIGHRYEGSLGIFPLSTFATVGLGLDIDEVSDPEKEIGLEREESRDQYLGGEGRIGAFLELLPGITVGTTAFYRQDYIQPYNALATIEETPSQRDALALSAELLWEGGWDWAPLLARVSGSILRSGMEVNPLAEKFDRSVRSIDSDAGLYRAEVRVGPVFGVSLYGMTSSGTRLPAILELFGNRDSIVSNPDLMPESSDSIDIGLRYQLDSSKLMLQLEFDGYQTRIRDLIVARQTSQYTMIYENQREGEIIGADLGVNLLLFEWLRSRTWVAWMDAKMDNRGFEVKIPFAQAYQAFQRLSVEWVPQTYIFGLELYSEIKYQSGFYTGPSNINQRPSLTTANLGLRISALENRLRTHVFMNNITDEFALDFMQYPLPGRTFSVSLEWRDSL